MSIQPWIIYATLTALFLAFADSFVKFASGRLSNSVALLIYGACTFATGLTWVLIQYVRGVALSAQPTGVFCAFGVGVCFSAVTVGLYLTFGAGAPISVASPFIRLGGLVVASVIGIAILGEPLSPRYVVGMCLVFSGLYLMVAR
jgi:drug/metabolite transporter (DMT)-like permease